MTELGKFLRKLRIDRGETMRDMAKKIGVSTSFLSVVETGKKPIPENFICRIQSAYTFTSSQIAELKQSIETLNIEIANTIPASSPLEEMLSAMSAKEIKEIKRLIQLKGGEISELCEKTA